MHKLLTRNEWIVRSLADHYGLHANVIADREQVFIRAARDMRVLQTIAQTLIHFYAYEDYDEWQEYVSQAYFRIHPSEKPVEEEGWYKLAAE